MKNDKFVGNKTLNNIIRFYPYALLILLIIQIIVASISFNAFPIPHIANWSNNVALYFFIYIFTLLATFGFGLFLVYSVYKIIKIKKDKENKKQHIRDLIIFDGGFMLYYSFCIVLNVTTRYIDWMVE